MTETPGSDSGSGPGAWPSQEDQNRRLRRRYRADRRFRAYGVAAACLSVAVLVLLLGTIIMNGKGAFVRTVVTLDVELDPELVDPDGERSIDTLATANYMLLVKQALRTRFPEVRGRSEKRKLYALVSVGAADLLRERVLADPEILGSRQSVTVPAADDVDMLYKGVIDRTLPESDRRLSNLQLSWLDALDAEGRIRRVFNTAFLTSGDSREPELAGVWGAVVGSLITLAVTLALCFPVGVAAAIYLEEFAADNRWNAFLEVNINNLAAVPSVVFGLLGLAVFLNFFGLPRSAPLVGGMVLSLMTLPTIIIAARSALKSVPPSIREAALGVGASPLQVVLHHLLPLALPGVLTGTIVGMSRALGESAPLLMIGMVAFIVDVPDSLAAPATVLPVQIYLWADSPERAFAEKTAAAVMVLLGFLVLMNGAAVVMRKRFERRW
ncbi:MAG: phosphate ABC transporter permease PstA [Deltaproteobacteria bacterium]|nr:phosphate ABC transporter permease PstA [Deltaproteobacteria bacterium]